MRLVLLPLLAASAALLPAQDDRDRSTPVGTYWNTGQSTTDLTNLVNSGWRITDIEIESTSPWSFTVAAVPNNGAYAKAWWYTIGATAAQLSSTLASNNARLIDIEPYDDAGTTRFVALMISNTGADAKSWWWYYNQTSTQVNSNVAANNGRLTNLERYTSGGVDRFATVMIANTGADFRSWGYLFGASQATISLNINLNGNRIYDIERVATDSYDVILMQNAGYGWWYYYDQTAAQVTEALQQNIGRIIDVERRSTLLGARYDVVMIDNANTLERAARQAFYAAAPNALGKYGFYLKEVNGPILAEMRADTTFEPASTMKTLYHVHAMRRVALGLASLSQPVNKPTSCGVAGSNQTLSQTLREMMQWSDNYSTLAISNTFGIANIDNTAAALGMSSTHVNYTIGCTGPSPENTLTLRDLTALHEQVANGYLGSQRDTFYELMANGPVDGLDFPTWGTQTLDAKIDAEAIALGLPNAVRDAFKAQLRIAYKPGGIGWTNPGQWTFYYAEGGWMSVPFKNASHVLAPREYTFGVFNYLFTGAANEVSGREAMGDAELELVWSRIQPAMATWDNHVSGSVTPLLGPGCPGASGNPVHQATGTPDINNVVSYSLSNAPPTALSIALFGFDNIAWNGVPLPIDFAPLGAAGCFLRIDAVVLEPGFTNSFGNRSRQVHFANDPSLIGARLYTQFLVNEPTANAWGWTITSAIRTMLGGWL
ncbi:MAG TPA: serine hydrolase [Planctomycetota bacterium]|nr:serine hydrolase [Planctomycetota bacterium]